MKLCKRIFLLILTLCLILPLSACKTRDADGWGTTAPDGEVTTPGEVDDGIIPLEEEVIPLLNNYLDHYGANYDMAPVYFYEQIDDLKNGAQLLFYDFEPSAYYYACAYYEAEHDDPEEVLFCCVGNYTWVGYNDEKKIKDTFDGKKIIAMVQVNAPSVRQAVYPTEGTVPELLHFGLIRRPQFVNGYNTTEHYAFEDSFYYNYYNNFITKQ